MDFEPSWGLTMMADSDKTGTDGMPPLESQIRALVDAVVEDSGPPLGADEAMMRSGLGPECRVSKRERGGSARWLVAAAAALILIAITSVTILVARGTDSGRVATTSAPQSGFDAWGPGWHQIDRSSLPPMAVASIAWFQGRLIVVGGSLNVDRQGDWREEAWAYRPETKTWSEIPGPGLAGVSLVVAGDRLVAVGTKDISIDKPNHVSQLNRWATWAGGDADWVHQDVMPENPDIGRLGPTAIAADRGKYLVWTGDALLDFTSGTVLYPETGKMGLIELPRGVLTYSYLSVTTPVWTGSEVVWPARGISTDAIGLKWTADGTGVGEIPAPPPEGVERLMSDGSDRSVVFSKDGRVVVMTVGPYVASFDPRDDSWISIDGSDRLAAPTCFDGGVTSGGDVVLVPCEASADGVVPFIWRDGDWFDTEVLPGGAERVSHMISRRAGSALVIWSLRSGSPDVDPVDFAAVWVPRASARLSPAVRHNRSQSESQSFTTTAPAGLESPTGVTTTSIAGDPSLPTSLKLGTADCTAALEKLPDLGPWLPANLDVGPTPGTGGAPNIPTCARSWGAGNAPAVHATQSPGQSIFGGERLGRAGDYTWSSIEDGWKIEHSGTNPWNVNLYGVTQAQVADLARSLAKL